jgi:cytochrome b561
LSAASEKAPNGYSLLQIVLHWTIAALVIFQLLVNKGIQDAFDDMMDSDPVDDGFWAALHIAVGVTVLLLAIVRVLVRLRRGAPPPEKAAGRPVILDWLAFATHLALYGFIFAMPLTGAIAWFGGSDLSAEAHELGKLLLIPLILLHAIGGFVEHFYYRNGTLFRMLKPDQS